MSKSPKSPFNLASGAWGSEKQNDQAQDQGPDKDNAAFRFDPPNHGQNPAPNLAPPGMSGGSGKSGQERNDDDPDRGQTVYEFTLDESTGYKVDTTEHPTTTKIPLNDGQNTAYIDHSFVKDPNGGEDIGKIARLSIADENDEGPEFKNGTWLNEPDSDQDQENVRYCESHFGELDKRQFKSFEDLNKDQENDHEI